MPAYLHFRHPPAPEERQSIASGRQPLDAASTAHRISHATAAEVDAPQAVNGSDVDDGADDCRPAGRSGRLSPRASATGPGGLLDVQRDHHRNDTSDPLLISVSRCEGGPSSPRVKRVPANRGTRRVRHVSDAANVIHREESRDSGHLLGVHECSPRHRCSVRKPALRRYRSRTRRPSSLIV